MKKKIVGLFIFTILMFSAMTISVASTSCTDDYHLFEVGGLESLTSDQLTELLTPFQNIVDQLNNEFDLNLFIYNCRDGIINMLSNITLEEYYFEMRAFAEAITDSLYLIELNNAVVEATHGMDSFERRALVDLIQNSFHINPVEIGYSVEEFLCGNLSLEELQMSIGDIVALT